MKKICKYLFILLGFVFVSCASVSVPKYEVEFEPISEEDFNEKKTDTKSVRIVHVSDFHSNDFGKDESYLIKKIVAAQPDVIVMTGDIFDFERPEEKQLGNVESLLDGIKDLCPIYYVSGNHEFYDGGIHEYEHVLKERGVIVADDKIFKIELPHGNILLAGISDPQSEVKKHPMIRSAEKKMLYLNRLNSLSEQMKSEKSVCDGVLFTMLIAHRPEFIEDYKSCRCFDLILSGHAHGGQWRIPFLVNGIFAPGQGYFPKYAGGRFDFVGCSEWNKNTVFIVSRGLSHQSPNFPRFFNPLELVVIDVK